MTPYTYGDNNEMLTAGSETWTWDHFGNAKTKTVSGSVTTFGWSFESELLSVDYPGTSADDSHEYDGHSLRMRSKLAGATNWTNFIHDELTGELLAEYTLIAGAYAIKALNTHGLGLISSNREGTKRYFHFDALGSTAALDDENEALKDNYTYEAFGVVATATSTNGPSVNPFRFVGQWGYYDDGAMGSQGVLLLLKRRYLSVSNGRFLTRDECSHEHPFAYVRNSPNALIDPEGNLSTAIAPLIWHLSHGQPLPPMPWRPPSVPEWCWERLVECVVVGCNVPCQGWSAFPPEQFKVVCWYCIFGCLGAFLICLGNFGHHEASSFGGVTTSGRPMY